jgi:hypothetical protein
MQREGDNVGEHSALKEAIFVLECVSEGQRKQQIVKKLGGDERRVSLWIQFAKDIHLLDQRNSGNWLVSDKGRSWIEAIKE